MFVGMNLQYGLYEGDGLSSAWRSKQHIRNWPTLSCQDPLHCLSLRGVQVRVKEVPFAGDGFGRQSAIWKWLHILSLMLPDKYRQHFYQIKHLIHVPFVCVAFDFMSMEMLDSFPFSMTGACCSDTITHYQNLDLMTNVFYFSFTSLSSIVLFGSGSSIHFPVHWGAWTVTLEGKRTAQQCENDSNFNLTVLL